jgi:preprotein translocase subunit SecE
MAKDEKNKKNNNQKNSFLKDSKAELKKVNWPTPKRLANDTATVIGIVLVVAAIVFVLDLAFLTLNEKLIINNEEKIKSTDNTTVVQDVETDEESDDATTEDTTEVESSEETTDESNEEDVVDSNVEETTTEENNAE